MCKKCDAKRGEVQYLPAGTEIVPQLGCGIPCTINVGTSRYTVTRDDQALMEVNKQRIDSGLSQALASSHHWQKTIILPDTTDGVPVADDYIRECLVHELVHCLFRNYGSNVQENAVEEEICLLMEHGLVPLLRDNPDLVKFLVG